jgi:BirA family biotin operon repressor/biotin-[acetyl-CoA-carboxylase] ligase
MPLDITFVRERRPENHIHYFQTLGSTMTEAARLAASGALHGTVVVADEQTAGVGRFGRQWHSEAETGIYCSAIMRLKLPPHGLPIVTLLLGLATAEAIQRTTDLSCDLRWPNDVLVNERKAAGILAQLNEDSIVAGIGINVNQTSLPDNLRTPATSLRLAAGSHPFSRESLLVALLDSLDEFTAELLENGAESILRAFTAASSYVTHRRIVFEGNDGLNKGVTLGLDNNGFLKVRDESGLVQTVYTGGVRPDFS